jgi:hypothetical protein
MAGCSALTRGLLLLWSTLTHRHGFLWQILFPLLDRVKAASQAASTAVEQPRGDVLMHHSRDTAEKQWAETRVLTLTGVARAFTSFHAALLGVSDFPRAWALLLEFLQYSAADASAEVALAAIVAFQVRALP